jgi:hypothetical protein
MREQYLEEHQSRRRPPTAYELKLAGAIEEVFGGGAHDLQGLVAGLAALGVTTRDGRPMTAEDLLNDIRDLEATG